MAVRIAVVSQKGGVGKSTLVELIAREYAAAEWRVLIADMDTKQLTATDWVAQRLQKNLQPEIAAQPFKRPAQAAGVAYDLIVFDGAPHSSSDTLAMAQVSDLIVLPSGGSRADLVPTIKLAHELVAAGIPKNRITGALVKIASDVEEEDARIFFQEAGFAVLKGALPERLGYRMAQNMGRAATETHYPSLNERAAELAQSVVDRLQEITEAA